MTVSDTAGVLPLGTTRWSVWADLILRSAGFPTDALTPLHAPDLRSRVDAALHDAAAAPGRVPPGIDPEIDDAYASQRAVLQELCRDPRFGEAVTWQNPGVRRAIRRVLEDPRDTTKRRQSDRVAVRYWQRYCAKNESIGFFGPVAWGRVAAGEPGLTLRPGRGFVARREAVAEDWAVAAVADALARDPAIRDFLPVRLPSHLRHGDGGDDEAQDAVLSSRGQRHSLGLLERRLVRAADGRPLGAVLDAGVADGVARSRADARASVERLIERGLLVVGIDVPASPGAFEALRAGVADLPGDARGAAERVLRPLRDAWAVVHDLGSRADGADPGDLAPALDRLATVFHEVTDVAATRRTGQTYAARSLCYLEASRDVQVVLGQRVLDENAAALDLVLRAAHWACARLGDDFGQVFEELYRDLAADGAPVSLDDLWFLAQASLFAGEDRPGVAVGAELGRRWRHLLGLDPAAGPSDGDANPGDPRNGAPVRRTATDLRDAARAVFPDLPLRWRAGRLHSPDLQLAARDTGAVERGDYLLVLGELHAGWATFDSGAMTASRGRIEDLTAALDRDLGPGRVRALYPQGWPRFTGRLTPVMTGPQDRLLGFADQDTRGAAHGRALRTVDGVVEEGPDGPTVRWGDTRYPLVEVMSDLIATQAVDAFKVTASGPGHHPRVSIDRLVVQRETWCLRVGDTGLIAPVGNAERYRAVRALAVRLGLPDRVFITLGTETKPVHIDLTSPLFTAVFAAMVRAAHLEGGEDTTLRISEMLPTPDQCPLLDARGNRYVSEFRLHLVRDRDDDVQDQA